MITAVQLKKIYPFAIGKYINLYLPFINEYALLYQVDTLLRLAAFLAQVGHESGQLRYCQEIASGQAYEGRKDLGNIYPGDGRRYKGRGLIQVTGRDNYTAISKDFDIDFVSHPERLAEPEYAVRSAFWFWEKHDLNRLADIEDFKRITKIINGGYNGINERYELYERAKKVLNI
jgi:putative chitinase